MNLLTYLGTAAAIIFLGVLAGVALGILLSLAKLVYKFSHLDIRIEEDPKQRRTIMYLSGTATFIRLPKLAAAVECVPSGHELHVRLERLNYIDDACLDLLMNWARQHEATGGRLIIDWDCLSACFKQFGASHGADNGHPQAQGHKSPLPALAGRVRSGRSLLQGRDHA